MTENLGCSFGTGEIGREAALHRGVTLGVALSLIVHEAHEAIVPSLF